MKKRLVYFQKKYIDIHLTISYTTLTNQEFNEFTNTLDGILKYVPSSGIHIENVTKSHFNTLMKYQNLVYELESFYDAVRIRNRYGRGYNRKNLTHFAYVFRRLVKYKGNFTAFLREIQNHLDRFADSDINYQMNKVYYAMINGGGLFEL